jgi:hypothetical protein
VAVIPYHEKEVKLLEVPLFLSACSKRLSESILTLLKGGIRFGESTIKPVYARV